MARITLNIIQPALAGQVYSCHGCGNCCRDFTVQVRGGDLEKLNEQQWESKLGFSPTVEFRGEKYLRQREDGSCVFLADDGRCRIHAEFGFTEKPIACQLFPFHLTPVEKGLKRGINFACQSVQENKGAELGTHLKEIQRMARRLDELEPAHQPPMLTPDLRATPREVRAIESQYDAWLGRDDLDLIARLDGLAFITQSLVKAKIANVRDQRFAELVEVLFGALPGECKRSPVTPPSPGQRRMLRQAAFARIEDPKIGRVEQRGKARTAISQFFRSRRFSSGKGIVMRIGDDWPSEIQLQDVATIHPASDLENTRAIDELITRWLRAAIGGGRAWGYGYYNWSIISGLQALLLNVAVIGWLARLHAAGNEGSTQHITIKDVRAALSRVDRTAGRAKWLGTRAELWRLRYFNSNEGLRRLVGEYALTRPVDQ